MTPLTCRLSTAQKVSIGVIAIGLSSPALARTSALDAGLAISIPISDIQNLHPCAAGIVFDQVSRAASVPLVLENLPGCPPSQRSAIAGRAVQPGQSKSARQLLDELGTLAPQFAWREMNGIIVVRPRDAWALPTDPLNQTIGTLDFRESRLENVLEAIVNSTSSLRVLSHSRLVAAPEWSDRELSLRFEGGTVLQALVALAGTRDDLTWQLGYSGPTVGILTANPLQSLTAGIVLPIALPK